MLSNVTIQTCHSLTENDYRLHLYTDNRQQSLSSQRPIKCNVDLGQTFRHPELNFGGRREQPLLTLEFICTIAAFSHSFTLQRRYIMNYQALFTLCGSYPQA